jgi:hypothetical protein
VLQPPPSADSSSSSRRRLAIALAAGAMVGFGAIGVLLLAAPWDWRSLFAPEPAAVQAPPVSVAFESTLPIPLRGETALGRARALAASGHLHDALAALDAVKPTDAQKADADRLRATLQRQLIDLAGTPAESRKAAGPLP